MINTLSPNRLSGGETLLNLALPVTCDSDQTGRPSAWKDADPGKVPTDQALPEIQGQQASRALTVPLSSPTAGVAVLLQLAEPLSGEESGSQGAGFEVKAPDTCCSLEWWWQSHQRRETMMIRY